MQEAKTKEREIYTNVPYEEQVLRILQVHNSKVDKIRVNFKEAFDKRKAAKEVGMTTIIDDEEESEFTLGEEEKSTSTLKKKRTMKGKKKRRDVGVEIKVKGEDGQVLSYSQDTLEDGDDAGEDVKPSSAKPKKKKAKIQSEETLEMLMNVMKPGTAASGKSRSMVKKMTKT